MQTQETPRVERPDVGFENLQKVIQKRKKKQDSEV